MCIKAILMEVIIQVLYHILLCGAVGMYITDAASHVSCQALVYAHIHVFSQIFHNSSSFIH